MKKLLREPLLHFLLLGAAIFTAHGLLSRGDGGGSRKIVVTQGQLAAMREGFVRTRQRSPTAQEWDGLVRDRVQEEVYYQEALALGLDKDDVVIRRRLRQKMEFVAEGTAAPAQPSDAQLQAHLTANAAAFATEVRFSFRHVYLDPQRHGADLARDAERLLAILNGPGARLDLAGLGDPLPLERAFDKVSAREVRTLFGETFGAALQGLAPGGWQGPVESGYGVHLVFLTERIGGGPSAIDEVRDAVLRAWNDDQQRQATTRLYQNLVQKYAVTIEGGAPAARRD